MFGGVYKHIFTELKILQSNRQMAFKVLQTQRNFPTEENPQEIETNQKAPSEE